MKRGCNSNCTAFVAGYTESTNFPVTANAVQKTFAGGVSDAFVSTISPNGNKFEYYSTLLGGTAYDDALGIALNVPANAFVTGDTTSPNFPVTTGAFQQTYGGGSTGDAFIAKVSINGDNAISGTAVPNPVPHGSNLTYTLTVTNNGPDFSHSLTLTDVTPSGTTFVSASLSTGTCTTPPVGSSGTVTCTKSGLAKGLQWTLTLVVNVNATSGSTITNQPSIDARTQDLTQVNNSVTISTPVD